MRLHAGGPQARAAAAARVAEELRFNGAALRRSYTPAEAPPLQLQEANTSACPVLGAPQLRLSFSIDASRLALAAADGTTTLLKLPCRRHANAQPARLCGHSAAVTSLHWSHSARMLLTASADGSACLWEVEADRPPAAPLLTLRHVAGSLRQPLQTSTGAEEGNPLFRGEVRQASFYYLDRFLLLANGASLHLYSYSIQRGVVHDARRANELRHKYRLQHQWKLGGAQTLTCFSAPNSFLSPLVLAAGSDRSLTALDLGTGQEVLRLEDAHERPVSCLRLFEGSAYTDAPLAGREHFLTAALDDCLKLWDLRSAHCVRRFQTRSRTHTVGAAVSPCLRYVCCGSDERAAHLFDMGSGGFLGSMGGHGEAVTDVAFNPLHPQVASTSLDGTVRFFSDRPEG